MKAKAPVLAVSVRSLLIYIPLGFVFLAQVAGLLVLYCGGISGKNDTMIDLTTQVPVLRFGWPILFLIAVSYHLAQRKKSASRHMT